MTEQEGKVMKSEKTLLKKYEIPLDHLAFEHVKKCNNKKELERIVKILRSGEEGYFPQLIECAESRLSELFPESRILRNEEPVLTKALLGNESWNKVADEMAEWTSEMKIREQALQNGLSPDLDLPAVRSVKSEKIESKNIDKQEAGPSKKKNVVPRSYSDWDKFDADKEILKLELEEEQKKERLAKIKKQQEREEEKKKKEKKKEEDEMSNSHESRTTPDTWDELVANRERETGNRFFHARKYQDAIKHYSESIDSYPTAAAYNNRSMAQLRLCNYTEVIKDCNKVLEMEPLNVKALYRRASAHKFLGSYKKACKDFGKIMMLEPDNEEVKSLLDEVKNRVEEKESKKKEKERNCVRYSIEDRDSESEGFVFPEPDPNIAVNEWGLAKVMCRCSGTPAWVHRKPPKCKICEKKRAERREEEAFEKALANRMAEENDSKTEATDSDDVQTDEKGSGDTRASEKVLTLNICSGINTLVNNGNEVDYNLQKEALLAMPENTIIYVKDAVPRDVELSSSCSGEQNEVEISTECKESVDTAEYEATHQTLEEPVASTSTSFGFLNRWNSLEIDKECTTKRYMLLRTVQPPNLASVIGPNLDGPLLSSMLVCIIRHSYGEVATEYLHSITQLPRFNIAKMFLQPKEKKALCRFLRNLEKYAIHPPDTLWEAFEIESVFVRQLMKNSLVFVKHPWKRLPDQPCWEGPFPVLERSETNFVIEMPNGPKSFSVYDLMPTKFCSVKPKCSASNPKN